MSPLLKFSASPRHHDPSSRVTTTSVDRSLISDRLGFSAMNSAFYRRQIALR